MKYDIIWRYSMSSLVIAVNAALEDGWKPLGSPVICRGEDESTFSQAVTLEERAGADA